MQPEIKKYLFDIIEAGTLIRRFTEGKTFADYDRDPLVRSAVERQFEIIGEALNSAIKVEPSLVKRIDNVRKIINFRNVLIHGYAIVSNEVVWGVIQSDLTTLMREVDAIYRES